MAPVLDELASQYAGRVKFVILDVNTGGAVASSYNVSGTPTLFFYHRGKLVDRVVGEQPRSNMERYLRTLLEAA